MSCGIIFGACFSLFLSFGLSVATNAFYDRAGLEYLGKCHFGENIFDDIVDKVDELFITSFNYNGMEPRFYSKFFGRMDGGR